MIIATAVVHTTWSVLTISVAHGTALNMSGGSNCTVDGCTITNAGETCLAITGTNHTARGNTVFGCGGRAIWLDSGNTASPETFRK